MKLYLVRHGQSETNAARRFSGWAQVSLTDLGRQQARAAGKVLQGIPFDHVFSSDLPRAIQTAQEALPGCQPQLLSGIREIHVGCLEKRNKEECMAQYGPVLETHRAQADYTAYGGENWEMLRARVDAFARDMEKMTCENIAAFAHEGTLHAMLEFVLGARIAGRNLFCGNCTIAVFEFSEGRWRLCSWKMPE